MTDADPGPTARSLIPDATRRFSDLVEAVPDDAWDRPTPCADWTVSELVNHVVSEHLWAPHILAGETIESVGDRYDGDLVGRDPVGAWTAAVARSIPAFEGLPSDDQPVHLSFGTVPADEYSNQMLLDLVVHGWDLGRAIGVDPQPEPEAVARTLSYCRANVAMISGSGVFGEPIETDSDDELDQLVALLGRPPAWTTAG